MPTQAAPLSGVPPMNGRRSEVVWSNRKKSPMRWSEDSTKQQPELFEVFRIGTERKEILTSQTAELKQTSAAHGVSLRKDAGASLRMT